MSKTAQAVAGDEIAPILTELSTLELLLCTTATRSLGAGPEVLTDAEREILDRDGFIVFPDVLTAPQVAELNARLDDVVAEAHGLCGDDPSRNRFPRFAYFDPEEEIVIKDLLNHGSVFDVAISHPQVLSMVSHILGGNMKLAYLHMRDPAPAGGHQGIHRDTYEDLCIHPVHYFCNSIWMLDDFTEENGPTRFVPGSHRWDTDPSLSMDDRKDDYPGQVTVTGRAGSVIVFDGHVWHGGTKNLSGARRRGIFSAWVHRGSYQIDDQRKLLHPATFDRLNDAQRFLIDVHGAMPVEAPDQTIYRTID